ncbi:MAG: hypothetical protein Q8O83_00980 [bacterium]|nr:hypothetical protein [bacterium]
MSVLSERINKLDSKRRDNIYIHSIRLFLEEEAGRYRGLTEYTITITGNGPDEIFGISYPGGEILMIDILEMPCFSVERFNERFAGKGICIEKIEK